MQIKFLIDEDIANYYKISMFIGFPHCNFKCDKQCGHPICQNSQLANDPDFEIDINTVVSRYMTNPLSHAIVIGGLEPLDDFSDLIRLIDKFRHYTMDDIVIYTGYDYDEITEQVNQLIHYENIIIKYGRFIPDQESHHDDILGVNLASPNQYAVRYDNSNK